MRKILLVAALLAFALPALPTSAADAPSYVTTDVDFAHLIAPPPVLGSPEELRDIAGVLNARANADDARRAQAIADAQITPYRFADVLGPNFREEHLPKTTAFFARVLKSIGPSVGAGKNYWHADRPFVVAAAVNPPPDVMAGTCNTKPGPGSTSPACPNGVSYSYPSGHSTYGTVVAILLAEMVPEQRDALLRRGRAYGDSRIINGVHFATDVEAGRIEGTTLVVLMMQNPRFRHDLADAKAELRRVLGLAP